KLTFHPCSRKNVTKSKIRREPLSRSNSGSPGAQISTCRVRLIRSPPATRLKPLRRARRLDRTTAVGLEVVRVGRATYLETACNQRCSCRRQRHRDLAGQPH